MKLARASAGRLPATLGAGVFAAIAFLLLGYPLTSFLALAFWPGLFGAGHGGLTLTVIREALAGYTVRALVDSCWVGTVAGLVATATGAWLAWLRTRTLLPGRRLIEAMVWVVLLMPSYFLAIGWLTALSPTSPLVGAVGAALVGPLVFGPAGVVLALSLKAVPLTYLATESSIARVSASLEEAGRVHGISQGRRALMLACVMTPALAAGFAVAFAESLSDFGVAATLAAGVHFPLATYAIYSAVNSEPLDFPLASAGSWLLLLVACIAIWLQARVARVNARYRTLKGGSRPFPPQRLSPVAAFLHGAGVALLGVLAIGVPAGGALAASIATGGIGQPLHLTLERYREVFAHAGVIGAFVYSTQLAVGAATVTVALGVASAWILSRRTGAAARLLDFVLVATMALPAIVLAAGDIFAYNQPLLPLYGGPLLLPMAYVTLALPLASRTLLGPISQLHVTLGDAAVVHGIAGASLWRWIYLPLLAAPALTAWLLTAGHLMFELPASELLFPPGHPTVAVALTDYLSRFRYGIEAALQLSCVALVGVGIAVVRALFVRLAPPQWQPQRSR